MSGILDGVLREDFAEGGLSRGLKQVGVVGHQFQAEEMSAKGHGVSELRVQES